MFGMNIAFVRAASTRVCGLPLARSIRFYARSLLMVCAFCHRLFSLITRNARHFFLVLLLFVAFATGVLDMRILVACCAAMFAACRI